MKMKTQSINRILSFALVLMMAVSTLSLNILKANAAEDTCSHAFTESGFCANCDAYQPATLVTDENYESLGLKADYVGYYEIDNAGKLYWFAGVVNGTLADVEQNNVANAVLTDDITVNEDLFSKITIADDHTATVNEGQSVREWIPIGAWGDNYTPDRIKVIFKGILDGQGHTVSGLYFNNSAISQVSLVGDLGGVVRNVNTANCYFYGNNNVGGVVGYTEEQAVVEYCVNLSSIASGVGARFGGVVGTMEANYIGNEVFATVRYCVNHADVVGDAHVGGIAGYMNDAYVIGCYNDGDVRAFSDGAAGIAGYCKNYSMIMYSYNNGKVEAQTNAYALLNVDAKSTIVDRCYNNADVCSAELYPTGGVYNYFCESLSSGQFASGEVAWLLQEKLDDEVWGQNIDNGNAVQTTPVLKGAKVYQVTNCKDETVYSNTNENIGHQWQNGKCTVCEVVCDYEVPYTNNGDGTHDKVCPVCGNVEVDNESHTLIYTAKGNTITETCSASCGHSSTATISAGNTTYNGAEQKTATVAYGGDWTGGELTVSYHNNTKAGTATASVTLGEATASTTFTIEKKELILKLTDCYKEYDGTNVLTRYTVKLEGFIFYDEGSYESDVLDYDDVYDDVTVDSDQLIVTLPGSMVGAYATASVSGITLTGEDAGNYTVAEALTEVPVSGYYGDFEISTASLYLESLDQIVSIGADLDQTAYTADGLPEGFTISGVELQPDEEDTYILINVEGVAIIDANGTDVTGCFDINTYAGGIITRVHEGHSFDANGFCATGECTSYMPAVAGTLTDEWGNESDCYLIYNAGQLYWFAQQVNEYGNNSIYGKLMADITVNADLTAENLREWTPIGGSYPAYYGTFDGNGKTISGLYVRSEGSYVGLFGYTDYGYQITDLHITNSYFEGSENVGAIFGYAGSYISGCTVSDSVTVKGNSAVGGIVGGSAYGELSNCWSAATVLCDGEAGAGLVGSNCLAITNCYTTASKLVDYNNDSYGGSVTNCYYLAETETEDGGKTAQQFASGEVAYLLQSGVTVYDEELGDYTTEGAPLIWGQTVGEEDYPVLNGEKVYKVTNCIGETAYSNSNVNGWHSNATEWDWFDGNRHSRFCYTCAQDLFEEHSYVDGICSGCGAEDLDYVEPVELFSLSGANVVLGNDLTMNFALLASHLDGIDYYAEIVKYNPDGTTVTTTYPFSAWTPYAGGSMYLITLDGLVAKQMSDKVEVTIYTTDGVQASYTWEDSIRDYSIRQLNADSNSAKVKTCVADMLNYGAAAQVQFKYNTSDLANATMTDTHKSYETKTLDFTQYTNNQVVGDNFFGTILALETNIKMGVFFKGTGYEGYTAKVSYRDHNGNAVSYEVAGADFDATYAANGMYGIMVDTLVAGDVYQVVTVEVYDGESLVASVSESMESYVVRQSASLLPIYDALMKFMVSSYNYSH